MKSDNNLKTRNTEMVTISRAEYERLQAQGERVAELEQQLENLLEAIRLAQKKRFGASSERLPEEALEQLSFLFNEPELCADEESARHPELIGLGKRICSSSHGLRFVRRLGKRGTWPRKAPRLRKYGWSLAPTSSRLTWLRR